MRKYSDHFDPDTVYVSHERPGDAYSSTVNLDFDGRRYTIVFQRNLSSVFGSVDWFELYEAVEIETGDKIGWVALRTYPAPFARILCDTLDKSGILAVIELLRAEGDLDV